MAEKGTLTFQVYAAQMALPIPNASVTVTASGTPTPVLIAHRTTDENGKTSPIEFFTPDTALSTAPNEIRGYALADVRLSHPGYYDVIIRGIQVFPGINSLQQMEMIPLSEFETDLTPRQYTVTPQNL
jgi:hypothetical protein